MIESFFIYQASDRRKMVVLKLIDDVLWVTHFILIGGYTAALTTGFAIFREIIFYYKGIKKWASSPWWAAGFSALFLACAPLTWSGIFSLFPCIASSLATVGFWINKTSFGKIIHLTVAIFMLVYSVVFHSYAAIFNQGIVIVSIAIFFARKLFDKRGAKQSAK